MRITTEIELRRNRAAGLLAHYPPDHPRVRAAWAEVAEAQILALIDQLETTRGPLTLTQRARIAARVLAGPLAPETPETTAA